MLTATFTGNPVNIPEVITQFSSCSYSIQINYKVIYILFKVKGNVKEIIGSIYLLLLKQNISLIVVTYSHLSKIIIYNNIYQST